MIGVYVVLLWMFLSVALAALFTAVKTHASKLLEKREGKRW